MALTSFRTWSRLLAQLQDHYRHRHYFSSEENQMVQDVWANLKLGRTIVEPEDFPGYCFVSEPLHRQIHCENEADRFVLLAILCAAFLTSRRLGEGQTDCGIDAQSLHFLFDQKVPDLQETTAQRVAAEESQCQEQRQAVLRYQQEQAILQRRKQEEAERLVAQLKRERALHEQQRQQALREREEKIRATLSFTEQGVRVWWQKSNLEIAEETCDFEDLEQIDSLRKRLAVDWLNRHNLRATDEQLEFIIDTNHSIRLTARAGSGKTETIATKILFLLHFIGLGCNHILALVFNKEARDDLIKRVEGLEAKAGLASKGPYAIMNFDRLARGVVCPTAKIIKDDELRAVVKKLVHEFLSGANENSEMIKQFMVTSFRSDWERWLQNNERYTQEQLINLRSALTEEAIDGTLVKSKGEKRLADFFFEHGLEYHYEFPWRTDRGVVIYPDFYLPQLSLFVEYWGLAGDKDYDETSEFKRRYWSTKTNYTLIEVYPKNLPGISRDFLEGLEVDYSFLSELITQACLERGSNLLLRRLSEEEILDKLKMRIETEFGKLVSTSQMRLGQRCRSNADVISLVNAFNASDEAERQFVNLLPSIDQAYRDMLNNAQPPSIDFSQLKWRCIDLLAKGVSSFSVDRDTRRVSPRQLRYIFIDEFQDFSELYMQMVTSLVGISDNAVVNAVGDDWQMINRFAGSDLGLFEGFADFFPRPRDLSLSINFRSHHKIVEFCNALMEGQGNPVRASEHLDHSQGRVSEVPITALRLNDAEEHYFRSDPMLSALFRLIPSSITRLGLLKKVPNTTKKEDRLTSLTPFVYVLSRTKRPKGLKVKPADIPFVHGSKQADLLFLEEALNVVSKSQLPDSSIRALTAHSSKGKEAEVVVLLAPEQFPLIHPSSAFLSIFGDDLGQVISDERRLFYVACSRARMWLLLLTFSPNRQPDFLPRGLLDSFDWSEAPYVLSVPEGRYRIEVASMPGYVSATYHIRQDLKSRGFKYDSTSPKHIWWQTLEHDLPHVAQYLIELIADFEAANVQWALFDAASGLRFSWPGPVDPATFLSASQVAAGLI